MDDKNEDLHIIETSIGAVVTHASRLFVQAFSSVQRKFHLSAAQYRIILELHGRENITQKDLIDKLDVEQSTVGNTLNRMAQDGLIERRPHPNDGRAQILCLTEKSIKIIGPVKKNADLLNEKALADFPQTEREQFFMLMEKLIKALKGQSNGA